MKHMSSLYRRLYMLLLLSAFSLVSMAQTLEITKSFKMNEFSTVLTTYKNEFSYKIKQGVKDNAFPYAVIEVHLKGDARAVTAAKEKLSLDMGALYMVESVTKAYDNKIVFLVSSSVRTIYMTCGDGCEKQAIFEGMQLKPDRIYSGEVRYYTPEQPEPTPTPNLKKQTFIFEVYPKNASVEVLVNGTNELCQIDEDIQKMTLTHGTYRYFASAPRYQTLEGMINVSDSSRTRTVKLLPNFGWLSLTATEANKGASAYVTNIKTSERIALGNIPIASHELDAGEYQLQILQNKYKHYNKHITIHANETLTESPILEPNFSHVTLITDKASDIYVNGELYGTGSWSGTLELGEYSIETRKANHISTYTVMNVSDVGVNQKIQLKSPNPIYGSLMVDGSPVRAAIYVDDKYVGESPMIINDLLIGNHDVRVEKNGYEKYEQTINIQEKKESSFNYALSNSAKVTIQVKNDSLANIYIRPLFGNGAERLLGKSVWSGSLAIGEYAVRTARYGHNDSHTTVVVKSTQPLYMVNAPSKRQGSLQITSTPAYSSVYINDKYSGNTPYNDKLSPGTYTAYITHSGYENSKKRTFNIVDGGEERLDFSLKKKRKKLVLTDNFGPYHLFELQYGYGLNVKDYSFTDHYVGMTYGYSPCRFGLNTSVNYGIYTQDIGISAGPTIRLTDMYSACNLQLMLGGVW